MRGVPTIGFQLESSSSPRFVQQRSVRARAASAKLDSWPVSSAACSRNLGVDHGLRPSAAYVTAAMNVASCCGRSEEHTSELQSLMRISYAVFCLKKKIYQHHSTTSVAARPK